MQYLINVPINYRKLIISIGFLSIFVLILGCSSQKYSKQIDEPYYRELSLFRRATVLLDEGQYAQARDLYAQFIKKYPKHPYTDDAAYRIAYLHVISDPANPFYDYQKARILFQKFIESYQNSHYITACKNWISILDLNLQSLPEKTKQGYVAGPETDDLLRSEIEKLREENKKLRHDLEQLQQALER